jgi:hypothetical protein
MAYVGKPESLVTARNLAALERGYRRDLQDAADHDELARSGTGHQIMIQATIRKDDITEQQLAALELRYRWIQGSLTEARARDAASEAATNPDHPERRRAMARVQHLQAQLTDIQHAMERLEERMRT